MKTPATSNWRTVCCWAVCAWIVLGCSSLGIAETLVTPQRASRYGLERMWFAQVNVDATRGRVSHWTLHHDQLFALTSSGTLQALDAETGKTLWTVRIGVPDGIFAGPSANKDIVALTSGSKLYVLDRKDGHVLWAKSLGGAAAAAPALSERYAFVGLMNGLVEGYPVVDRNDGTWMHQSIGRIYYSPTVTGEVVCWPTDRGYLYVAQSNQPRVMFRVETDDEIVAPPAEWQPFLYVTSRDGYLYCLHELSGEELWRVSTGYPIITKPAAVAENVFVASEEPALHAVQAATGRRLWTMVGAAQFAAVGAKNVYGVDRLGGLLIIDKEQGGLIGRLPMNEGTTTLVNDQSDRIFLVTETGLVQCLRERSSPEPTYYRQQIGQEEAPEEEETEASPFVDAEPVEEETSPDAFEAPAPQPFVPPPAEDEVEEDADDDDNPFF